MTVQGKSQRFELHRHDDMSGVSGIGVVAEGIRFSNGIVALQWTSEFPTSVLFHTRGMESVEAVHGHGGATQIIWIDSDPWDLVSLEPNPFFLKTWEYLPTNEEAKAEWKKHVAERPRLQDLTYQIWRHPTRELR